jgi:endonuclease/exonuclease/phosphatase family metal-dependent hydrolase
MVTANPLLQESEQIEFGSPVPHRTTVSTSSSIVVASYNIRYAVGSRLISGGLLRKAGFGGSAERRQLQVAQNINTAAHAFTDNQLLPTPDVLAIQEADKRTERAGRHHVARELAEAIQVNWIHVPAGIPRGVKPKTRQWWLDFEEPIALNDTGDTGIALLSRLPVSDVARIDLPWDECAWRPRLAMAATIDLGPGSLRILSAHVDPHAAVNGQLEQLEALMSAAKDDEPTLIVGDFNTLSNKKVAETRHFLEAHGFSTPFPSGTPTWRGMSIRLHADWIFGRGVNILEWGVARPLSVSDHWPIWARVELR